MFAPVSVSVTNCADVGILNGEPPGIPQSPLLQVTAEDTSLLALKYNTSVDASPGPFTSIWRTPVSKPNGCVKAVNPVFPPTASTESAEPFSSNN